MTSNATAKERDGVFTRLANVTALRAVRDGLVNIIPILIIGAFPLVLLYFPIESVREAIGSFAGGSLKTLLELMNNATFGLLGVYMTFSISRSYMNLRADPGIVRGGGILAAMVSFFILTGVSDDAERFSMQNMRPQSMFLALLAGLGASALYYYLSRALRKRRQTLFSAGADREFNRMLSTFIPIGLTVIFFALLDIAVIRIFDTESVRTLLIDWFNTLFSYGETGFFKGFLFVLFSSVLWFFGIHGSDVLEDVMQTYFAAGGPQATDPVLRKEFFDCFVLMGGCGATICLLIALLIFSRSRARRTLSLTAALPMVFNINELMVFGLPIIFNPIMLIPFLLVPLFCYTSSYLAIATGIVPAIANEAYWTTPIILGGYTITGSYAGALLQLFNVIAGVLIYMPFVRLLDKSSEAEAKRQFTSFMDYFKANENDPTVRFTELNNAAGVFAKSLCADLRHSVRKGEIVMAYQPQYAYDGRCIGTEALLRYKHHLHGVLYPPLVIRLAEEGGFLLDLEEAVVEKVLSDRDDVLDKFGRDIEVSFNVTGTTVVSEPFLRFLRQLNAERPFAEQKLCLEITEQTVLTFNNETRAALAELREMGLTLAIDDFSMGQTSINYLKDTVFDVIKLDGSLVKGLTTHQNCREIISSIVGLSATLNLTVLAEFVETEQEREILHEIGCDCYQGWLYSPAVFLDKDK